MTRQWFRAAALLWGTILALGILGYLFDSAALAGLGFALRRLALGVTLLWLLFAALGAFWARLRGAARRR